MAALIEIRCRKCLASWVSVVERCLAFIEEKRAKCGLEARTFVDPALLVGADDSWTVFFSTESEIEAVVGVDFIGDEPRSLTIGD